MVTVTRVETVDHPDSGWTHPLCCDCWRARFGDRSPVRLTTPDVERCCGCASPTTSGIYFRQDQVELPRCPWVER